MKTGVFTVDNVGDPDAVIATKYCEKGITIYEQNQAGTTDYDVYAPTKTDVPVRRPAGAKTEFPGKYQPGDIVGYVAAVTAGSYTFAKEEA